MVKFNQTKEDIVALTEYGLIHHKAIRKTRLIGLIGGISFPFLIVIFLIYVIGMPIELLLTPPITIGLIATIAYSIYNIQKYAILSRFVKNTCKNVMKKRDYSTEYGKNEISIDSKGVHRKNKFTDEHKTWKGVTKIVETPDHIFLFVTDASAFIVPIRAFHTDKEKNSFLQNAHDFNLHSN